MRATVVILLISAFSLVIGPQPLAPQGAPPLETIAFETEEGTWISLDVSPDGATLVFELLGEIYSLPASGGTALPLLTGRAFQSQPRFSPDGLSLVYVSDETGSDNVWVSASDGSDARAISDFPRALMWSPAWSANGREIYVSVLPDGGPRQAEIWKFDVGTGEGTRLVENGNGAAAFLVSAPAPGAYGPAPSADGRSIFYTGVTPRPYGSRDGASSQVMRYDLDTGLSAPVTLDGLSPMKPGLSADGRVLVYGSVFEGKTGLRVRELATGTERWLRHPIQRHQLEGRATRDVLPNFAIAPDGRSVFAAFGGKIHRLNVEDGSATEVPFKAQVALDMVPALDAPRRVDTGPVRARQVQDLAVAPDGRVAFSALARVYVAGQDGEQPSRLTDLVRPREFMPAWSPDGSWVAFVTWDESGGHLWKARASGGSAPQRLSRTSGLWADPVWTPDGSAIVALHAPLASTRTSPSIVPPNADVVEVAASGGPTRVLASAGSMRKPHFGADPNRIYFTAAREGLVSIGRDGSERRVEVGLPDGTRQADFRVNPAGDRIAVATGGRLVSVAMPAQREAPLSLEEAETWMTGRPAGFAWAGDRSLAWIHSSRTLSRATGPGAVASETTLTVEAPRSTPRGTVVLRGATVLTMRGDEVLVDADVVVTDNRIAYVGPKEGSDIPQDATVVDVSGKVIVPGFIDVHAHAAPPRELLEPESSVGFANLAFGITSFRNPQSPPGIFALADVVAADGVPSPRIFSTGPGLAIGSGIGGNYLARSFGSLDEVRGMLLQYRDEFETHLLKTYLFGNRQQRQWVVQASHELGMMPTTEGGADSKANLTHAIDGFSGNEHALPVAPIYDDVAQLIARSGITYTPTAVVSFGAALPVYRLLAEERPHENVRLNRWFGPGEIFARSSNRLLWFAPEDYNDGDVAAGAARIVAAGGRVALGGHGEVQGLSNHWEMQLLADGGMEPHDVLRAATLAGAEAMGYGDDLGSLEAGKLADLVVLDRDPLVDIRATQDLRFVMKNGVLYEADDLDQVWPERRSLDMPWWTAGEGTLAGTLESRIDETVRAIMDENQVPAVAVAVVNNGDVILSKGYGVANLENDVPATTNTVFQSGSLGKQFTSAGVMALVEDGLIELGASIRTYLPDTPDSWQPITIRHLLTHSSGIPDYTSDSFDYREDYSEDDLVRMAGELELEFEAGERWNYSNTGYVMLGVVIGKVTGVRYWEFLRERIFEPAGMPTVRVNTEADVVPHRARGYLITPDGWQHASWVAPELNTTADGSLLLSLRDMIAWNETVRNRSVLSRESWDSILSPMVLNSGRTHPYGFGWFIDEVAGQRQNHHGGTWQGFTTNYSRYETDDLGIIVLTNARSLAAYTVVNQLAALMNPAFTPQPPPTTPIPDSDPEATQYVSSILEKISRGDLEHADFDFLRRTLFPRIKLALTRTLDGMGSPDRLELLSSTLVGDDRSLQYFAWYGERRFRVMVDLGPRGGLTALRVNPEPR